MRIPFLSDFWNKRAQQNQQRSSIFEVGQILLPSALAGILGLTDTMARIFAPLPKLIPFLTVVPIIGVTIGCGIIVSRRKSESAVPEYFYPELLRRFAKLLFIPLLAIALFSVWPYVPNAVAGRRHVGGFICQADTGHAVAIGRVQVLDSSRNAISGNDFRTDSIGFFYVEKISNLATEPAYLRFINPECRPEEIAISSSTRAVSSQACPSDPGREQPKGEWPVWSSICTKR